MSWVKRRDGYVMVIAGTRIIACPVIRNRAAADTMTQVALAGTSVEDLLSAARTAYAPIAGSKRLSVVVSDVWLSNAELPWSTGLLSDREAPAYVSTHMALLGVNPGEMHVAIDDAPFGQPRLVTGIAVALTDGINRMVRDAGLEQPVIRPLSCVVHQAVQRQLSMPDYAFAVLEEGAVSIAVVRNRRIQQITTQRLHEDTVREVEQCWRRMQLRDAALAEFEFLQVVDLSGQAPAFRSDRVRRLELNVPHGPETHEAQAQLLDIAACAASSGALAWQSGPARGLHGSRLAAACIYAVLLLAATWSVVAERREVLSAQARLAQMSELRTVQDGQPLSRTEKERLVNLQEQLEALEMPLDELLIAIRPPAGIRAALLGIDISGARARATNATLRLTAEAASSDDMAKYVSHLARTPPFTAAYLTRHETAALAMGVYRFTVEASWTP